MSPESLPLQPGADGKPKPRVLIIAPIGEGVGGVICQTNQLVHELDKQQLIDFKAIDSTVRYRAVHNLSFLSRAWGGSWQAVRIGAQVLVSCIKFKPEFVQIASSASLGLVRDIVLVFLLRLLGARVFVTFHFGRIPELARQRNWEWRLLSGVVRMASSVQVLDAASKAVLEANFPKSNIHQFPNAVACDWIDAIYGPVRAEETRRSVPRLIFVGMVLPTKGVVELVAACAKISDVDFELEMVGPVGPEMQEQLSGIAAKRNAGRWLNFTGALSRAEAVAHIAAADVFVLPSYTEGFPGSVLEAMACRVAIVATSVGAIPEMLLGDDGKAVGMLVPPRDVGALRLAVEDLLKHPAKRSELGAAARRKCEANYELSGLARHWVALWADHNNSNRPS